jgi:hypothetical protein
MLYDVAAAQTRTHGLFFFFFCKKLREQLGNGFCSAQFTVGKRQKIYLSLL